MLGQEKEKLFALETLPVEALRARWSPDEGPRANAYGSRLQKTTTGQSPSDHPRPPLIHLTQAGSLCPLQNPQLTVTGAISLRRGSTSFANSLMPFSASACVMSPERPTMTRCPKGPTLSENSMICL